MTDEQKLLSMGWSQEEIDEAREQGVNLANNFDVAAAWDLAKKYLEHDDIDKVLELLDAAVAAAEFYSTRLYEVTGREIYWNETSNRWTDFRTGQFVSNPYVNIEWDSYEIEQYWINRYT